jgi:hypothetical protein
MEGTWSKMGTQGIYQRLNTTRSSRLGNGSWQKVMERVMLESSNAAKTGFRVSMSNLT